MMNVYFTDNITLQSVAYNTWGSASNTPTNIRGRFQFKTKMVRNLQGEQVVSTANVLIPVVAVTHKDKIIYGDVTYSILGIELIKDFSSKCIKLYLA